MQKVYKILKNEKKKIGNNIDSFKIVENNKNEI